MIILRRCYSLSDEEYNSRLKFNRDLSNKEIEEYKKLEKKYKSILPDRSKEIEIFSKAYNNSLKNAKLSRRNKINALGNALRETKNNVWFELKNKKVRHHLGDHVKTENRSVGRRIKGALKSMKLGDIKECYNYYKDGIKQDMAYNSVKHLDPSNFKQTPAELRYEQEQQKISKKYKPLYKNFN